MPESTPSPPPPTAPAGWPEPDQWDFSDCTEEELYFCFGYEYGREIEAIHEDYRQDKARGRNFDADGYWQCLYPIYERGRGTMLLQLVGHLFLYFPLGFPSVPYLNQEPKTPRRVSVLTTDTKG